MARGPKKGRTLRGKRSAGTGARSDSAHACASYPGAREARRARPAAGCHLGRCRQTSPGAHRRAHAVRTHVGEWTRARAHEVR